MSYKKSFFDRYQTTHVAHEKGEASIQEFRTRASSFQNQFGMLLPKDLDSRMIDLGCVNGSLVWWLQQMEYENVVGIDVSAEQVELASSLNLATVTQAEIRAYLSDKHDNCDLIFLRDVL